MLLFTFTPPISSSPAANVGRRAILGRPHFLFTGGVHLRAILWSQPGAVRRTCPSHLRHLCSTFHGAPCLIFYWAKKYSRSFSDSHCGVSSLFSCHISPTLSPLQQNGLNQWVGLEELDFQMLWSLWKELRVFPVSVSDVFLGTTVLANLTSQAQKVVNDVGLY